MSNLLEVRILNISVPGNIQRHMKNRSMIGYFKINLRGNLQSWRVHYN